MVKQKTNKELRKFGLIMTVAFSLIAGFSYWKGGDLWFYLGLMALVFLLPSLVAPGSLSLIEKKWMQFGEKLSVVISYVILFSTFYLVITPMAIVMRMLKHDPLHRRIDKTVDSYWISSDSQGSGARHFLPY
jgi:hypothetical protein